VPDVERLHSSFQLPLSNFSTDRALLISGATQKLPQKEKITSEEIIDNQRAVGQEQLIHIFLSLDVK
jgi:hypothetical protein